MALPVPPSLGDGWECPFRLLLLQVAACGQGWAVVRACLKWVHSKGGLEPPNCIPSAVSSPPSGGIALIKAAKIANPRWSVTYGPNIEPCKALATGRDFLSPPSSVLTPPAVRNTGRAGRAVTEADNTSSDHGANWQGLILCCPSLGQNESRQRGCRGPSVGVGRELSPSIGSPESRPPSRPHIPRE